MTVIWGLVVLLCVLALLVLAQFLLARRAPETSFRVGTWATTTCPTGHSRCVTATVANVGHNVASAVCTIGGRDLRRR